MGNLKKRLLGTIVGGIVGVATVGGVGVALASNGNRSGGTPATTSTVPVSTSSPRVRDERASGRHDAPGDQQGQQGQQGNNSGGDEGQQGNNSGGDEGQQGNNSGGDEGQSEPGDDSGSSDDQGEHGDSFTSD